MRNEKRKGRGVRHRDVPGERTHADGRGRDPVRDPGNGKPEAGGSVQDGKAADLLAKKIDKACANGKSTLAFPYSKDPVRPGRYAVQLIERLHVSGEMAEGTVASREILDVPVEVPAGTVLTVAISNMLAKHPGLFPLFLYANHAYKMCVRFSPFKLPTK